VKIKEIIIKLLRDAEIKNPESDKSITRYNIETEMRKLGMNSPKYSRNKLTEVINELAKREIIKVTNICNDGRLSIDKNINFLDIYD
jgi:Ca2+-binding EF-hand superfamily protein